MLGLLHLSALMHKFKTASVQSPHPHYNECMLPPFLFYFLTLMRPFVFNATHEFFSNAGIKKEKANDQGSLRHLTQRINREQ